VNIFLILVVSMLKVPSKTIQHKKAVCFVAFLFIACKLKCSRNEFVYRNYCAATLAKFVTVARLNVLTCNSSVTTVRGHI